MTTSSNTSNHSDQYAQQWIDFLRKRNTLLSVICFFAVVFALLFGLTTFYFYQQGQTALLENTLSKSEAEELALKVESQDKLIKQSTESLDKLNTEYERVRASLGEHTKQLADASANATVSEEIIENLNAQLGLLKEENEALASSLSQVRESLLSGASNSEVLAADNTRLTKEVQALNKKLGDRKVAYLAVVKRQKEARAEMDRLISINEELSQKKDTDRRQLATLQSRVSKLNKENSLLQKELDAAKNSYAELESKLASAMSPIGVQPKASKPVSSVPVVNNVPVSNNVSVSQTISGSDGLEEIQITRPIARAPISKPQSSDSDKDAKQKPAQNSFDYDTISVP